MAYSSKYYDPQKAHEYYEAHKKLKGRRSTAGLNQTGRTAAKYVKQKLTEEKKAAIEKAKSIINNYVDQVKARIEQLKEVKKKASEALKAEQEAINREAEAIKNMPDGPAKDRRKEELKKNYI